MKRIRLTVFVLFIAVSFALAQRTEYTPRLPEGGGFAKFDDVAAWTYTDASVTNAPAKHIPGTNDWISDTANVRLDLGGKTCTVGGWYHPAWGGRGLAVTNGTLVLLKSGVIHSGKTEIFAGGTLRCAPGAMPGPGHQGGDTPHVVRVARGGTFDLTGVKLQAYGLSLTIDEGGRYFGPSELRFYEADKNHLLDISGTAVLPTGFDVLEAAWNPRQRIRLAPTGALTLGGPVAKNGRKMKLDVLIEGGVIEAVGPVFFDADSVQVADNATLAVTVAAGARLDLSGVTFGSGVKITKRGEGLLIVDSAAAAIEVLDGGFAPARKDGAAVFDGVTMRPGTWLAIGGAEPLYIRGTPPAWMAKVDFRVDADSAEVNRVVFNADSKDLFWQVAHSAQETLPKHLRLTGSEVLYVVLAPPDERNPPLWFRIAEKTVEPEKPVDIALEEFAFSAHDAEKGSATLCLKLGTHADWTLNSVTNCVYLTDGTEHFPLLDHARTYNSRITTHGESWLRLRFALPADVVSRKMRFVVENGIAGPKAGAKLIVARGVTDTSLDVHADVFNRAYYVKADGFRHEIKSLTAVVPNPDSASPQKTITVVQDDSYFRRRFPEKGPDAFSVKLRIDTWRNGSYETNVIVRKTAVEKGLPAAPEKILVGICGYGQSYDLVGDIVTNNLCNLFVWWHGAAHTHPDNWPEEHREDWWKIAQERNMYSMSIYAGDSLDLQARMKEKYGERYLGNNAGEYASYLYQGAAQTPVPMNQNLRQAKEYFVNRFIHSAPRGWMGRFPFLFSTSGSALSHYELQGGMDYICNELYAIGAQNLAFASSEARGASRRWKPEYWCSWLAEEWQSCDVPYHVEQKYDLLKAGLLQQYLIGTSLIVLESGASGTQAWKYTNSYPGQKEERKGEGYHEYVAEHYRKTMGDFWQWVEKNPRDKGSPETHIALALGNLDSYVGMNGGFAVWGQHENAQTNRNWRYGAPETTWTCAQGTFFPCGTNAIAPYSNRFLAGSPYGQVDIVGIDDELRASDLARYRLLAFAGWNTMEPSQREVLGRAVEKGTDIFMCLPHWSTRIDREYTNYRAEDLILPFGVAAVREPVEVRGKIEFSPAAPKELAAVFASAGEVKLRVADIALASGAKVLASIGGKPLLVQVRLGKGTFTLFTGWDYPGAQKNTVGAVYSGILRALADAVPQSVRMTVAENADDLKYVCYAVYPKTVYVLNVDTRSPRKVRLSMNGKVREIALDPCGFKAIPY